MHKMYTNRVSNGDPKVWLDFMKQWTEARKQLKIETGPVLYSNYKTFIEGNALIKFNKYTKQHGNQSPEKFDLVIQDMAKYIFPKNALSFQQWYVSSYARKPSEMSYQLLGTRLPEENDNLQYYPPNYDKKQCLKDKVLKGTVFRTAPRYHQNQVTILGFDMMSKTTDERIELFDETESNLLIKAKCQLERLRTLNQNTEFQERRRKAKEPRVWCSHCQMNNHTTESCGLLARTKAESARKFRDTVKQQLQKY